MHGCSRIRKRLVASIAILLALAIAVGVALYFSRTDEKTRAWREFYAEVDQVKAIVENMRWECPPNVDQMRWEAACDITCSAVGNVCYTPEHVSMSEMRRLREDIERKAAEPASLDTLRWIWHRLAQTGPHGKECAERMIVLFDETVASDPLPDARDMNRDKGEEATDPGDTTGNRHTETP
jgi:hypothetical protein